MNGYILVVGSYGAVGRVVATRLAERYPGQVIAAGRNYEKANDLSIASQGKILPQTLNILTAHENPAILDDVALVIMCLDLPDTRFVEMCLQNGIDYIDVSASYAFLVQVEALHEVAQVAGGTAVLSVGISPGLTNLLGRYAKSQYDDLQQLDIHVLLGLGEAHGEAADVLADQRYDAIVVDEAQDFRDNWWMPLQYLLHDPDGGIFYIFYDDNQRLYDRQSQFPIQQPPYPLSINCRNTRNIHKQVLRYYQGEDSLPTALGPKGRPVEFLYYSDQDSFHLKLDKILQDLILKEQVPPEQIVVLTPLRKNSWLWEGETAGSISLTSEWPPKGNQVFATTIHSFKGLESAVVLLAEIERWPYKKIELENLLYVACSRARNHLIILRPVMLPKAIARYFN